MVANVLIDNFLAGGPIMYPILITAVVAVAVVGERAFFWWRKAANATPKRWKNFSRRWRMPIFAKPPGYPKIRRTRSFE